jgi:hypothetical protein
MKQLHTEDLQQQVKKLQKTNQQLFEANVRSVGKLSGMKAHIEGLNLEITMLQIELDPQQEPYSSNASFNNWEQGCPEKALAPFDSRSDTFGFHTSLDFSTGQSSMEAVLDQHSGVSTSKVKTRIGTEVINSRAREGAERWTESSNCKIAGLAT